MTETREPDLSTARTTSFPPFPPVAKDAGVRQKVRAAVKWANATRPVRTVRHWANRRGGTLAGGMAFSGLFSGFAALLVFFSIAGLVLANNEELLLRLIDAIAGAIPGLIGEDGMVTAERLLNLDSVASFTLTGLIALVSALWTALNFLNGARLSIRAMFDLPIELRRSFVKMKLIDLGLLILFALGILISTVLTAASSGITEWLLNDVLTLDLSGLTSVLIRVIAVVITFLFDSLFVAGMIRWLSEVRVPPRTLRRGAFIGGGAIAVLKQLGSLLLEGASANPLLAAFAAIIGVLLFMNFLCIAILLAAAWVKVTMDDAGQSPRLLTAAEADEIARGTELRARRERLAAERIRVSEELARTPRGRRRKLLREYDRIVEEQAAVLRETRERRLGYDPSTPANEREGAGTDAGRH